MFLITVSTTRTGAHAAFVIYASILLIVALIARLPLPALLWRTALVLPLVATFAIVTWLSGDTPRAIVLVEKSLLCGFAALLLISSTPFYHLLRALESLGVPKPLILTIQFLHRYLFVISGQAQHMRLAAQCRHGLGKHPRSRFAAAAGALGVLFARSWERADGIYRAMLSRGFAGHFPRLAPAEFRAADAVFLIAAVCVPVAVRVAI